MLERIGALRLLTLLLEREGDREEKGGLRGFHGCVMECRTL